MKLRDKFLLVLVFTIASLQLLGYLTGNKTIRGLGLLSAASPLPFVFTAHEELETFAQTYAVSLHDGNKVHRVSIDAELYGELKGAYNLRNAYGAVFSHGPVLTRTKKQSALIDSVVRYGFYPDSSLVRTFNLDLRAHHIVLKSRPTNPQQDLWRYEVSCP